MALIMPISPTIFTGSILPTAICQPAMGRSMVVSRSGLAPDQPVRQRRCRSAWSGCSRWCEAQLGQHDYLAGNDFTAADIMSVFSLTTMRLFQPLDLAPYPNVLAYLQRIGARPGYQRAMAKGDPDLKPAADLSGGLMDERLD